MGVQVRYAEPRRWYPSTPLSPGPGRSRVTPPSSGCVAPGPAPGPASSDTIARLARNRTTLVHSAKQHQRKVWFSPKRLLFTSTRALESVHLTPPHSATQTPGFVSMGRKARGCWAARRSTARAAERRPQGKQRGTPRLGQHRRDSVTGSRNLEQLPNFQAQI